MYISPAEKIRIFPDKPGSLPVYIVIYQLGRCDYLKNMYVRKSFGNIISNKSIDNGHLQLL